MAGSGGRGRRGGEPTDAGREAREQAHEAAAERGAGRPRGGQDDPVEPSAAATEAAAPDATDAAAHEPVPPIQAVAHEAIEPDPVTDGAMAARGTFAGEPVAREPVASTEGTDVGTRPAEPTTDALVDHTVDRVGDIAEDPIAFGAKLGEAVVEGGDSFATATTERIQDGVQTWAERTAEAAGVDLPDRMGAVELVESGGETGARIIDKVGAYVEKTTDATWDAAKDGADWATETADDAFEAGSDLAGDAAEDVFDAAADAADDLAATYEDAAGAASQATEDAEDTLTDILDSFF